MKNNMLKKTMVFVIIILFFGASVVSGINSDVEKIEKLSRDTLILIPTDDTVIRHYNPNNPAGSAPHLFVQNEYGATSGWAADVLIWFDTSLIPPDTTVEYATLKLYYYEWGMNNPAGRDINLYRITSDWDEVSVTWNTQPSYSPQLTTFATVPSPTGIWMEWDVTSDVQGFISGSSVNYGWKLTDENYWGTFDIPQPFWRSKDFSGDDVLPYLEIEIINEAPEVPDIAGKTNGKAGVSYIYSASSIDPDGNQVYYWFDWGDNTNTGWVGPYVSGATASESHIWTEQGAYVIKVKAKDIYDEESTWATLEITMPMNQQSSNMLFLQFLQNHPRMFPILRHLFRLE